MDANDCFKFGFFCRCVAEGLTDEQIEKRASKAGPLLEHVTGSHVKAAGGLDILNPSAWLANLTAAGKNTVDLTTKLIDTAKSLGVYGTAGALALPVAAGLGTGYLAGKAQSSVGDFTGSNKSRIKEIQKLEMLDEYDRAIRQAARSIAAKQYDRRTRR